MFLLVRVGRTTSTPSGGTDDTAELQLEWIPCSLNLF